MKIKRPKSKQPIPKNAKKVFSGILFDTYQWEVDGYDGSKKVFEKLKRPDTAKVIPITEDGKIIIALQEQPNKPVFLGTIGGRIDEGEDALGAAKRELLEETGYEARSWTLFDAVQPVSKIEWAIYTFIAKGCKKVAEQDLDGAEKIDLKFVSFDEFVNLIVNDDKFGDEFRIRIFEAKLDSRKMEWLRNLFTSK
jgi:8-oxo-dGTP pyrophosphatase MutT (NUDIX family)